MIFSRRFSKAQSAARAARVGKEFYPREANGTRAIIGIFFQAFPAERAFRWEEEISQGAPKRAHTQRLSHPHSAVRLRVSSFVFRVVIFNFRVTGWRLWLPVEIVILQLQAVSYERSATSFELGAKRLEGNNRSRNPQLIYGKALPAES
jgi:hypothetical protein